MLERMESMAGRIVANELMAMVQTDETDGSGALDEFGREKLRKICHEFHQTCAKVNREQEIENLHWRVQAIATGQDHGEEDHGEESPDASQATENPVVCPPEDTSSAPEISSKRPA